MRTRPTSLISFGALALTALASVPARATTFNFSTLDASSGKYYTGVGGTGTEIFNSSLNQVAPWTEGTGSGQASINFSAPGMGNNAGKVYMSAGGLFPIPTGQTLGSGQSGYSGDYAQSDGFPFYFTFSNPTYDNPCGFNCNTITGVPVTVDSLDLVSLFGTATITGYSDLGHTAIDSMTITGIGGTGIQSVVLDWTNVEDVSISGSGYYLNDIEVNDPVPSAAPEPSSLFLLGTGLLGLGGLIRRRVFA